MVLLTETNFDEYKESFINIEDKEFTDENAVKYNLETTLNSCINVFIRGMNNYL